jgi:two-component system response regulator QseB
MRILLVEDDDMIGRAVSEGLTGAGFSVDWAQEGRAAELWLAQDEHELVILDLGLPGRDGMALLRSMRARGVGTPVLIVSARDTLDDRVGGLNEGADDYLLKPFDLDELVARIRAVLRRHAGESTTLMTSGAITLDPVRRVVSLRGEPLALSTREFALLETLMRRPGAVLSRKKLEDSVYNWDNRIGSNAIEVHLHNLRKKLGADAIVNVRGVGYRMAASS